MNEGRKYLHDEYIKFCKEIHKDIRLVDDPLHDYEFKTWIALSRFECFEAHTYLTLLKAKNKRGN